MRPYILYTYTLKLYLMRLLCPEGVHSWVFVYGRVGVARNRLWASLSLSKLFWVCVFVTMVQPVQASDMFTKERVARCGWPKNKGGLVIIHQTQFVLWRTHTHTLLFGCYNSRGIIVMLNANSISALLVFCDDSVSLSSSTLCRVRPSWRKKKKLQI